MQIQLSLLFRCCLNVVGLLAIVAKRGVKAIGIER